MGENTRIKFSERCVVVLTSLEPTCRFVGAEIFRVGTKPYTIANNVRRIEL